jgi:hypothetical protein
MQHDELGRKRLDFAEILSGTTAFDVLHYFCIVQVTGYSSEHCINSHIVLFADWMTFALGWRAWKMNRDDRLGA